MRRSRGEPRDIKPLVGPAVVVGSEDYRRLKMKTAKTLAELLREVERRENSKRDFLVDTQAIKMVPTKGIDDAHTSVELELGDHLGFGINNVAHRQIGEHVGVPAKYYDRMLKESPDLLSRNVNHWLDAQPAKRQVRTLDGNARAFLSSGYRPLDNVDLAEAVVPVLLEQDIEIISCEITDRRLYIKGADKRINRDIPSGRRMGDGSHVIFDTVSPAIVISNSEVGMGALSIETGIWTKACTNMAIFAQRSMKKYHIGGRAELSESVMEMLSDKTKKVTDASVWMQVADVVKGAFDAARFEASLEEVKAMSTQRITGDVAKVVEVTARRLNLQEGEQKSILRHLIEGADLTRYGLFNAITRTAEDLTDYDRATEFERAGGQIIELAANDWRVIAEAA